MGLGEFLEFEVPVELFQDAEVVVPAINLEPDTGFVAEGADINEADPDLSELVLNTGKVACLVKLSREQISQPNASATVTHEINRAMVSRVNFALLQQAAPVSPATWPPAGLLTHATNGGVVTDNLDAIVDAIAAIEEVGGTATHILAAPSAWAALNKLKMFDAGEDAGSQSNASLLGSGTVAAQRTLLNVPVTSTVGMPTKGLLVLDKRMTLSAYGTLNVAVSEHVYFGSDNIAVRATIRFGAGFSKAGAGVKLTVA
ncbi:phage major capsid protein [Mycobacteroides abscessus]|uniref:phage major capsid protein n=1 Tax=Mycobacteroides abscessus TaxID=36809 RepID=UPI0009C59353|nr:phage major capsid protein [Mycobacteroides abscessus]MDO3071215.1 phage major capsid protein [Mycobacteroides abscessus subsp. bolletii]SKN79108.1 phage major capsid protein, HK97 [Mycobacteroides abscessus subsp. bolletii]SKW89924.1 phage major capsid protein, HK97 [Mycobacteroides abscessus subsp. bolletii]